MGKAQLCFPFPDISPIDMKFILTKSDLLEISLILEPTRKSLEQDQVLHSQNRH